MQPEIYEIMPAPDDISRFVRRYMYAEHHDPISARIHAAPTGCCYLGHVFNGEVWCVVDDSEFRFPSGFHLSGQIDSRQFDVCYSGPVGHIMAELTATAPYCLLGIPADTLGHLSEDVRDVLRHDIAEQLISHLEKPVSRDERVSAFNDCIRLLAKNARPEVPHIDEAVRIIEQHQGRISIADLCDRLNMTERSLSRRFRHIVGVTPKFYARAVQLNTVVGMLYLNDELGLAQLAHDCGYYDQAHFIHTMQQFMQKGPTEFLQGDHHMFNVFIAQSRKPEGSTPRRRGW